jgi:homoserine dehydrogenase
MSKVNVGIIGFGTVGSGTVEALIENREIISNRAGTDVIIRKIADLDIKTKREVVVARELLTTRAMDVIEDPEIHIVVELIGGVKAAKEYILKAMEEGKHVVTANKALLAEHGQEIYQTADRYGVSLAFEASVGGGIPIIRALRSGLSANRIKTVMGILNGTSNYILTRMTRKDEPYNKVVQDAVDLGLAEDPPTLDVDGTDAAHKLAILISIAFGSPASFEEIYREGISSVTPDDIRFARELGYCIKLLAISRVRDGRLEARVHPAMIPRDHILANVNGAYNAIYLDGDLVGPNLYYGLGAGKKPTASAVVSDIIDLARHIRSETDLIIPPLAHFDPDGKGLLIRPMEDLVSEYYFRVSALDKPGVLSTIAGILADQQISISSVIQKERETGGPVPLVMLTHEAVECNVQKAVSLIDQLDVVMDKTVMIRVENR